MGITKTPAGLYGLTLTSGAANVKGAYFQLTASTPEAVKIVNYTAGPANSARRWLTDIATGAGGAEVVVIANIYNSNAGDNDQPTMFVDIPISIASSTRIAARTQNAGGVFTMDVSLVLVGGTITCTTETYGADTANSDGTAVDAGAVANTKGLYAQLTASTGITVEFLNILVGLGANTLPVRANFALDIATGAGGAETVVVPDLFFTTDLGDNVMPPGWGFPLSIASGTRIAARIASQTTDATDRVIKVEVIGSTSTGFAPAGGGETSHVFVGGAI